MLEQIQSEELGEDRMLTLDNSLGMVENV